MLAIPGIAALIIFIYARPQEFFERLRVVPFLYVFFALALVGGVLDFRMGNVRLRLTPQLPWVALFFVWSACTVLIRVPGSALTHITGLAICVALYALIAHGVHTFRSLHIVAGIVFAMVLLVCAVGAHQGFAPMGCVVIDASSKSGPTAGTPDGRPCDTVRACYLDDADPGTEYACEHIGLFGTTSVGGGRVRYRGVLQDPNELALAGGIGLPLGFAFGQVRRKKALGRRTLPALAFVLVLVCAVLTASRGGQLVFSVVLGAYFLNRFGPAGLTFGAILATPLLLFGGRSGEEASSSTLERIDCWAEALSIWRSHPLLGVGLGQFGEYNYMTAHNSYLLALSELGLPGMILFSIIVYLSAKIPITVLREITPSAGDAIFGGASIARPWAMALTAAFAGLGAGIFLLSFTYHYVLWIYIGLSGALYSAVRTHVPTFKVRFGWRDLALVTALDGAIVVGVYSYTKWVLG
jgi:O-antigen ligase